MTKQEGSMYYFEIEEQGPCLCCGKQTNKITFTFDGGYMCSEKCDNQKFNDYIKACQSTRKRRSKEKVT